MAHSPPLDVRQVALILGLKDLQLSADGQWQARDRYDNEFTLAPQLIESTLRRSGLTAVAPPQVLDEAV